MKIILIILLIPIVFITLYELIYHIKNFLNRNEKFKYFDEKNPLNFSVYNNTPEKINKFIKEQQKFTDVDSAPIIGWKMKKNLNSSVIVTDNLGFANHNENIDFKYKIGIFGASVAQGAGAWKFDNTLSNKLMFFLREKYGKNLKVFNFAQSSFTMIQEISLFCLIQKKYKFDLVIFIDGHNDINSLMQNKSTFFDYIVPFMGGNTKHQSGDKILIFEKFFITFLRLLKHYSFFLKNVNSFYQKNFKNKLNNIDLNNIDKEALINQSFKQCFEVIKQQIKGTNTKVLMTLQPMLYNYENKSSEEEIIISKFNKKNVEEYKNQIKNLQNNIYNKTYEYYLNNQITENVICVDFTKIFENTNESLFIDDCHFLDKGHTIYAQKLYNLISRNNLI